MTPEERERLIQRYYDGEAEGAELAEAEHLLDTDPEALALIENLATLSDSIKMDVVDLLPAEDFSTYWDDIAARLPEGPPGQEGDLDASPSAQDGSLRVVHGDRPIELRSGGWRKAAAPVLAGLAAAVAAAVLLPEGQEAGYAGSDVVSHAIEIEEIESPSSLVMVQQETPDVPAIIWIVETEQVGG